MDLALVRPESPENKKKTIVKLHVTLHGNLPKLGTFASGIK